MDNTIIKSIEEALEHLETYPPQGISFQLAISESFTFAGRPDTMGAGMAVILDKILSLGYEPDGFEQRRGFKIYKYRQIQ